MQGKELLRALEAIEKERNIPRASLIEGIKEAIDRAYKREIDPDATIEVAIDANTGDISIYKLMKVVRQEDLDDDLTEIALEEARKIDASLQLGDFYKKPIPFASFSRLAVHHIKQVIMQKASEAQKDVVYEEWNGRVGAVIRGEVEKFDPEAGTAVVNLGTAYGFVSPQGAIRGEKLEPGKTYDFYVQDVRKTTRSFPIVLSRSAPGYVTYLLKNECPEVQDGTVEVKAVAREAGLRCKLAVWSNNPAVDPVGACVGKKGVRINTISRLLNNEKIDVIQWDEDTMRFIMNAMSPAQVAGIVVVENTENYRDATVIVPDDQLSLAIGKKGSTARLAAQLTGWNLDIKSMTQAKEEEIEYELNGNLHEPRKPRAPRGGLGTQGGFAATRSEYSSAPARSASRGPMHFDIGNVFDDNVMDEYEQASKKHARQPDPQKQHVAAEREEVISGTARPAEGAREPIREEAYEDLDSTDLEDLYEKKK